MLVFHLVFQASPGIHGNRAQLDFRIKMARIGTGHVFIRFFQFQNNMITAIPIGFDVTNIIFFFDKADAVQALDEVNSLINIIKKTADDADADGIADIVER